MLSGDNDVFFLFYEYLLISWEIVCPEILNTQLLIILKKYISNNNQLKLLVRKKAANSKNEISRNIKLGIDYNLRVTASFPRLGLPLSEFCQGLSSVRRSYKIKQEKQK